MSPPPDNGPDEARHPARPSPQQPGNPPATTAASVSARARIPAEIPQPRGPEVRQLSDRDLDDTIEKLTPVVGRALAELPMLPEHVEEARTLLALCRIEQRRRRASNDATKVGWCE